MIRLSGLARVALGASLLTSVAAMPALAQQAGGAINIAIVGELPTLDPMATTTDLVGDVTQHVFETLYTFDSNFGLTPMLAQDMPEISADGTEYLIKLRTGITFHDGSSMDSADVVASLNRWLATASRAKGIAGSIEAIEAVDAESVRIKLNKPVGSLLALLSFTNSAAVIMPEEKLADPLVETIGTGPYKLGERKPDQYIQLLRFDDYSPREEATNGYGGARVALADELRFVPVPDASTRIEAALAGQFDYVSSLPIEAVARFEGQANVEPVVLESFGWPVFVMNKKAGLAADIRVRKAVRTALNMEDMLIAAFGDSKAYSVNGSMYPSTFVWHTDAGVEGNYNVADADAAKALLTEAGYDGKPLRILTSRQYEFHYKMAQVAAEYLKLAGFAVEMDVVDWATLSERRGNPELWDIYITHSSFLPEPGIINLLSPTAPGWWESDARTAAMDAFNAELDPAKRVEKWADVQRVIYDEVPFIKIGDFSALASQSKRITGLVKAPWPYFWNVSVAQ
jgi:peptide/nickel transport system substrate-binding protein